MAGDDCGRDREQSTGYGYRVPKRDLVVGLQMLVEGGGVELARGLEEGEQFVKELRSMQVSVTTSGHERFEAGRSGEHDDLVIAVALACWRARKDGVR